MSVPGGPLVKVGTCAQFGAAVFKASILNLLWGCQGGVTSGMTVQC